MNVVNKYGEKQNGFAEVVAFCYMTCRYFDKFLLQGVDKNWRQAYFFYLAPSLICEGYWQVNSRSLIFRIADPTLSTYNALHYSLLQCNVVIREISYSVIPLFRYSAFRVLLLPLYFP